ncbi:GntR family transcriptional regulator [Acuticoccus sediminis]|uniref:GntR family transcriptional regulator n=1 Tax=Acuticoccus sediminis TaxID=2184697 RepID=UPI001CFCCB1E|nr:GntR family transcriptional regulator [Acuticoccus sediminis]
MAGASSFKRAEALPEAIANHIAQAVASRHLTDGERIVETALAAELGVSRVPVREALKILATQGILEGGGHRGYKVVSFSERTVASVQEARFAVETLFMRDAIAAWRDGRSDVSVLNHGIEAMARAARNGDMSEMLEADVAFHTLICEAAQNPIYMTLWTAIARHVLIILNLARFRDVDLWVVVRRHEALRDLIVSAVEGDVDAAEIRPILENHILAERQGAPSAGAAASAEAGGTAKTAAKGPAKAAKPARARPAAQRAGGERATAEAAPAAPKRRAAVKAGVAKAAAKSSDAEGTPPTRRATRRPPSGKTRS